MGLTTGHNCASPGSLTIALISYKKGEEIQQKASLLSFFPSLGPKTSVRLSENVGSAMHMFVVAVFLTVYPQSGCQDQAINQQTLPLQESSEARVVVLPVPLHCWLPNFPTSECLFTLLVHGEKNSIYETTKCCFSSLIVETAQRGGFILYHLWPCWDAEIWLNSTDQLLCNSRPPAGFLFYQRLLPHSCGKNKRVSNTIVTGQWVILSPETLCGGREATENLFVSVLENISCWNVFCF